MCERLIDRDSAVCSGVFSVGPPTCLSYNQCNAYKGGGTMSDQQHVQKTLEMVVAQIQALERQINEKKRTANDLSKLLDSQPVFPDAEAGSSSISTLPDEYYGRQMPEVI